MQPYATNVPYLKTAGETMGLERENTNVFVEQGVSPIAQSRASSGIDAGLPRT